MSGTAATIRNCRLFRVRGRVARAGFKRPRFFVRAGVFVRVRAQRRTTRPSPPGCGRGSRKTAIGIRVRYGLSVLVLVAYRSAGLHEPRARLAACAAGARPPAGARRAVGFGRRVRAGATMADAGTGTCVRMLCMYYSENRIVAAVTLSTVVRPRVKAETSHERARRRRPRTAVVCMVDLWARSPTFIGAHGGKSRTISRVNNWSRASGLRSACLPATNWLLEAARIILQHALAMSEGQAHG